MTRLFDQLLKAINYEISDGSEITQWKSLPDAHYYDCITEYGAFGFAFSTADQMIYEITATSEAKTEKNYAYRWLNPAIKDAYKAEHIVKDIDFAEYCSGTKWIDLDEVSDIMEKGQALIKGEPFDERVVMSFELEEEIQLVLFRMAHDRDITFNELIAEILQAEIDRVMAEHGVADH